MEPEKVVDKPRAIFIVGGPGCGKGTQCKKIKQEFTFAHYSIGTLLRDHVDNKRSDWQQLQTLMNNGQLVSSQIVVKVVKEAILTSYPNTKTFMIDGFPRNMENLQEWNKIVKDEIDIAMMLYFECDNEQLKKRLLIRAKQENRADDNEQTILKRFNTFETKTIPVVEKCKETMNLCVIDGMKTREEVFNNIKAALQQNKLI